MRTMAQDVTERVLANPAFQTLVRRRTRFAWTLTAIMLVVFYGYVMVVAFKPELLGVPMAEGMTLSIGFPIGAAIIILSWLLTAIYVRRANNEFEALTRKVIEELK